MKNRQGFFQGDSNNDVINKGYVDKQLNETANRLNTKNIARTLYKLHKGDNVIIEVVGDSIAKGDHNTGTIDPTLIYAGLLKTYLESTYGVTVTVNNRAVGGYCVHDYFTSGRNALSKAVAFTFMLISFGHNDGTKSQGYTIEPKGYDKTYSVAAIEHIIRETMILNPDADIVLITESPYPSIYASDNALLLAYNKELRKLADAYPVMFVDAYQAFIDKGDYSSYIFANDTHPNELGHALMAKCLIDLFAAPLPMESEAKRYPLSPVGHQAAYDNRGWVQVTKDATGLGNKFLCTGTWTDNGDGSFSSTTAGAAVFLVGCFSEAVFNVDISASTSVQITVDGQLISSQWDTLACDASTGYRWCIPLATAGIHSIRIYLRTGGLKIKKVYCLQAPQNNYICNNSQITYSAGWADYTSVQTTMYNGSTTKRATANNETIAFRFIGTGVIAAFHKMYANTVFTCSLDGAAATTITKDYKYVGGRAEVTLASGLEYGEHTVLLTFTTITTEVCFEGFSVLDDRKIDEPRVQRGLALVGDTVTFPTPYAAAPTVELTGNGVYPTNITATGFTVAGTAGALARWKSTGSRICY